MSSSDMLPILEYPMAEAFQPSLVVGPHLRMPPSPGNNG